MWLPGFIRGRLKHREMVRFYSEFVNKEDLCYDIGANMGERVKVFRKLNCQVIAVEPDDQNIDNLTKRYESDPYVKIVPQAVGRINGEELFYKCKETSECSTLSSIFRKEYGRGTNLHWEDGKMVPVVTLDKLIDDYGKPRFCKIDVEGYEANVVAGLSRPIPIISFEFNRRMINETSDVLKMISDLGGYRCNFIEYEIMKLKLEDWVSPIEMIDVLLSSGYSHILTGEVFCKLNC